MYRFALPDIGEGVVEAEIVEWKVAVGDPVAQDQPLVVLLTDKAEIEVPSPRAGRVQRLAFEPGQVARVGDVLVEIDDGAASAAPGQPAPPAPPRLSESAPTAPGTAAPPRMPQRPSRERAGAERGGGGGVEAVPAVRELARRLGVDLRRVAGTGPGGRVMRRDVEAFHAAGVPAAQAAGHDAAERAPDPPDWRREPLRGLRRAIAERMVASRRTAAHFTYVDEVDMTGLLGAIEASPLAGSSPLAFIAHACVRALASFPVLNASIDDARGEIVYKGAVHLGVATATDGGLVVPVIRDAAGLGVAELARRIAELAERARAGQAASGELSGSTFTLSSLGKLGGVVSTPILNPPEVAILGVNAIRRLPRVVDEEIRPRQVMNLSLSVDHRIADGLVAARFIEELRRRLEAAAFDELKPGEAAS